jgi:hypothetical protein
VLNLFEEFMDDYSFDSIRECLVETGSVVHEESLHVPRIQRGWGENTSQAVVHLAVDAQRWEASSKVLRCHLHRCKRQTAVELASESLVSTTIRIGTLLKRPQDRWRGLHGLQKNASFLAARIEFAIAVAFAVPESSLAVFTNLGEFAACMRTKDILVEVFDRTRPCDSKFHLTMFSGIPVASLALSLQVDINDRRWFILLLRESCITVLGGRIMIR